MDHKFDILEYAEPIFRFCLKRLNSRTDAEDLSQEILLHVLDGMKKQNVKNPDKQTMAFLDELYCSNNRDKTSITNMLNV